MALQEAQASNVRHTPSQQARRKSKNIVSCVHSCRVRQRLPKLSESTVDMGSAEPMPRADASPNLQRNEICNRIFYPMWIMPFRQAMALKEIIPHQDLIQGEQLVKYEDDGDDVVVFVSHQWVGLRHPDPHMKQFRVLQDLLRKLMSGNFHVQSDPITQIFYAHCDYMGSKEKAALVARGHIWYDYFCVPQLEARTSAQDMSNELQAAVDSIPGYVENSHYFMILAPPVAHADLNMTCDYVSWMTRGWCRTELFARALCSQEKAMERIILLSGQETTNFIWSQNWLSNPPGLGEFTVEQDRARVAPVVHSLLEHRLKKYLNSDKLVEFRFLLAQKDRFMSGLDSRLSGSAHWSVLASLPSSRECSLTIFCREFRYKHGNEVDRFGLTPLHFAAWAGRADVIAILTHAKADVNVRTKRTFTLGGIVQGSSPLHIAFFYSSIEAASMLIQCGADVFQSNAVGCDSIFLSAFSQESPLEKLKCVLALKGDPNQRIFMGMDCLQAAAMSACSTDVLCLLLDSGASLTYTSKLGLDAMAFAMLAGRAKNLQYLVDRRADVNQAQDCQSSPLHLACRAAARCGVKNRTVKLLAMAPGATPLHMGAFFGVSHCVEVLLQARAIVGPSNSQGLTALDVARKCDHDSIVKLLADSCKIQETAV